jgi:hypothetical protein
VRFDTSKLKGHVALWWECVLQCRIDNHKEKIDSSKKMVRKMKDKFFHVYYEQVLCTRAHNLRQRE